MASRGPSGDEIDDFLTRVSSATDKIQALVSGKLDAEDLEGLDEDGIRIKSDRTSLAKPSSGAAASGAGRPKVEMLDDDEPADESPEEKKARLGRQADSLWDDAQHRKAQERSRWWRFAHLQFDKDEEADAAASAAAEAMADATGGPSKPGMVVKTADGRTLRTGSDGKARGADIDYSRWDKWVESPDDPATQEELQALEKEQEAARDRAFEEANPSFVKGFLGDMEKRKASRAEKQRRAGEHKAKGNGYFKAGEARRAAGHYHAAVELDPFAEALHTNLAAAYLRMGDWAAAEEHGSRAVMVTGEAGSSKGLFRRAIARRGLGDWAGAAADLAAAAARKGATGDVKTEAALADAALTEVTAERDSSVVAAAAAALKASGLPDRAGKPVTTAPSLSAGSKVAPAIAAALAACDSGAASSSADASAAAPAAAGSAPAKLAVEALKGLVDLLSNEAADEATRLASCRLVRATGLLSAVAAGLVSATTRALGSEGGFAALPEGSAALAPPVFAPSPATDVSGTRLRRRRQRTASPPTAAEAENAPPASLATGPLSPLELLAAGLPCPGPLVLALPASRAGIRHAAAVLAGAARLSPAAAFDVIESGALVAAARGLAAVLAPTTSALSPSVFATADDDTTASAATSATAPAAVLGGSAAAAFLDLLAACLKAPGAAAGLDATSPAGFALRGMSCAAAFGAAPGAPASAKALSGSAPSLATSLFGTAVPAAVAIATAAHTTEPEISPAVLTAALAACDIVTAAASPALANASKAAAAASQALAAGRVPEAAAAAAGMPPADRPADAALALGIVPALCRLVAALFARSLLDKEALAGPVGERATAALAALSAHETARPAFAVRVGRGGASSSSAAAAAAASAAVAAATADRPSPAAPPSISSSPALRPLLDLLRLPLDPSPAWDVVRGNSLAALSNAALGTATTARAVVDSGAVRSLLDFLDGRAVLPEATAAAQSGAASAGAAVDRLLAIAGGAAPGQAIDLGVPGPGLRGRAAALLSRLAADEAGARLLAEPANVARVTILLARCAADGSTGEAGADVDSARTQDALLRCLAGAVSVPAARAEFVRAGGIRAMGAVLKTRGGEAATRARANGLGNLARAAIQLSGAPGAAGAAMCAEMCRQDVLDGLLSVVKQVGAHPARKNAAVALARLAKGHPSCSERLRELDGVKVLLSLGSELR